jgi:negative regulator of sigma E activity
MNEQEQSSQLSALFDGELPTQQAEMVIRRALKDASLRGRWERYALIGACLRGEPLAHAGTTQPSVAQLVRLRLAAEAEHGQPASLPQPASPPGRRLDWGRGLMGGAIAASVALVAVLLVHSVQPASIASGELLAQQGVPAVAEAAPRSYTTPGENSPASRRLDQPLAHYLVAHSEAAASNLGFSYDLTQGAVEMTEAEIKAHR